MRVTLTKHCGHGAKPLSHGNKEILSSFVRRCPYLRLASVLFLSRFSSPLSLSLSLSVERARSCSFTYFYLHLFATVRIITPLFSSFAGHHVHPRIASH